MNPYIGNNPYTMQSADIGYPQVNYQSSPQDTSMQDMFHNQALQQMQQLATPTMPQQTNLGGQIALAKALREFGSDGLWKGNQTPITSSALTSGMNLPSTGVVGLGAGPSGYGLGTGSTANVGANMFPTFGS